MDVGASVDEVVKQAGKEYVAGNYRGGVELLLPFLRPKHKDKLSLQQEFNVVMLPATASCTTTRPLCRMQSGG